MQEQRRPWHPAVATSASRAATGIATIHSIGNLGGFGGAFPSNHHLTVSR
jgi:hypothetical protein